MGIYTEAVQKLYIAYINRPADPSGLAYWEAQFAAQNGDPQLMAQAFAESQEYRGLYANMSNTEIVNQVYLNLFARPAEASGLRYWSNLLDQRQISITDVVTAISAGAVSSDLSCYRAKVSAAHAFTDALDTPLKTLAYVGDNAAQIGRQYIASVFDVASLENAYHHIQETIANLSANVLSLTAGIDTVQGSANADIFLAGPQARGLNPLDTLDGGEGHDRLSIVVSDASHYDSPSKLTISNLETIDLSVAASVKMDSSSWQGVTTINSASRGNSSFIAASETNLRGFVDLQKASLQVDGGNDVHFTLHNVTPQLSVLGGADVDPLVIDVGSKLAPTGAITLHTEIAKAPTVLERAGVIKVNGGSSVSVTQNEFIPRDASLRSVAHVFVTGTELTKSVNLKANFSPARLGNEEEVQIRDVHAGSDQMGSINTVTVEGHSMVTIKDNALRTLNLSYMVGKVTLENAGLSSGMVQTLALNLTNLDAAIVDSNVYTQMDLNLPRGETGNIVRVHALGGTALNTINVSGEGELSFASDFTPANLHTLQASGKVGVSGMSFDLLPQLSALDLSGNLATNNFSLNPNRTSYVGGDSSDTLYLSAEPITKSLVLGGGDDAIHLGGVTASNVPTIQIMAGAGTDSLFVKRDLLRESPPAFLSQFKEFERLALTGPGSVESLDLNLIPGIANLALYASSKDVSIHSFPNLGTLELVGEARGSIVLNNTSFAANVDDRINLALIDYTGRANKLVMEGVEQLNLSATRVLPPIAQSSPVIVADALQKLSVVGNGALSVDLASNSLKEFDASGFQGPSLRWASGALQGTVLVKAGAASNNVFDMHKASAATITYQGGSGADVITLAAGAHNIKLGSGADHVRITAPNIDSTSMSTISEVHRGVSISLPERGLAEFQSTKLTLSSTASLQKYLDAVVLTSGDASVNAKAAWFQWNGDTYYAQSHHDVRSASHFVNGTDIVVKLTGLLDLSTAHMAANNTLTLI